MPIKHKILIIDDDPAILAVLSARFSKKDGYEVFTARDGSEGITVAQKKKPHLILLDWMMPRMTGISVLEQLKGDSRTTWIPTFMLTSKAKMIDVERALSKGAEGYFTKPLKLPEMSARLNRVFEIA
jgi:DNA-binding response OmpR family regulator